jgi:hypothetical protein
MTEMYVGGYRWDGLMWTGLFLLGIDTSGEPLVLGSIRCWEVIEQLQNWWALK